MSADKGTGAPPLALSVMGVSLRAGTESDLPAIVAIEQLSFLPPWPPESFLRDLRNPSAYVLVAEQGGVIIGYLCCWLVGDEAHILKVAVHPNRRRFGVAKGLLLKTLAEVRQKGAFTASLEVRRSNQPAISLYRQLGFRTVTVRRRYYENGEDALLMVRVFSD